MTILGPKSYTKRKNSFQTTTMKEKYLNKIEKNLKINDLLKADEIFMTGTAAEVKSVTKINKTTIGNGKPGKITKEFQKSFMDVVMGKNPKFLSWLKYI